MGVREHQKPTGSLAGRYRGSGLWRGVSLGSSFDETCARLGSQAALVDATTTLGFDQLHRATERLAGGLERLGVRPGDAVAYMLPNWWEAAATLLATVRLGAIAVPIVPFLRAREVSQILAETQPSVVVAPESRGTTDYPALLRDAVAPLGRALPEIVLTRPTAPAAGEVHDFASLLAAGPPPRRDVDAARLAVVIYTSGSTAAPKGAMHTHETLDAELQSLRTVHDLGPRDRVLMPSPLTHISGVVHGILAPALLGTSAVLMDRWEPGAALAHIEARQITYMIGAPTFLQEMLAHPNLERHDLSSLRLFSCGGASVPAELMRRAREKLPGLVSKRVYGSSEFPTISTTSAEDARTRGLDTEGRALPGVELEVCDADGTPVPAGTEGEIRARGPDCMVGYADSRLNAETFDEKGFLRTGDLGVLDDEGYLTVTGRVKDIIVRKGEKISAREVEDLIIRHASVAEVAVIPLADAAAGEIACACVRLESGATPPTLEELVAFLRELDLTARKLPERLVTCPDFPRAPSGKIHKKQLRDVVARKLAEAGAGR